MRKTTKCVSGALVGAFVLGLTAGAVQACPYHDSVAQTPMPSQEVADGSQTPIVTPPGQGS